MKVEVSLFGAFRDCQPGALLALELQPGARVSDLRQAMQAHAQAHWPNCRPGLLRYSAFASAARVLREDEPLPADGRMAVLPPVSGG